MTSLLPFLQSAKVPIIIVQDSKMDPIFAKPLGPLNFPSIEEVSFTSNFHAAVQELMKDPTAPKHEQELLKAFMAWTKGAASEEGWGVVYLRFAGRGGIGREEIEATKVIGEAVMELIEKRKAEKSVAEGTSGASRDEHEYEQGSSAGPKQQANDAE